jgi:hypothetical protein
MPIEILALGSFAVMVVMWAILPSRLHRGHSENEE